MDNNVGSTDRLIRIVVGLGLVSLVFIGPQTNWGWLGLIPIATGFIRFCPAYTLFNFSTAEKE